MATLQVAILMGELESFTHLDRDIDALPGVSAPLGRFASSVGLRGKRLHGRDRAHADAEEGENKDAGRRNRSLRFGLRVKISSPQHQAGAERRVGKWNREMR